MIAPPPPVPSYYAQTTQKLVACGIPAAGIRMRYEEMYRSDVVAISDIGPATTNKLRCLQRASYPRFLIELGDTNQDRAFHDYETAEGAKLARAEAAAWLGKRRLLGRVPRYDPAKGVESFQRALEAACRLPARSALETSSSTSFTFRRSFIERVMGSNETAFICLSHMIAASKADDQGVSLVIIGNEAYGPTP